MVTRQRLAGRIARLESAPGYWIPKLPDCPDTRKLIESADYCRRLRAAGDDMIALILEVADAPERAAAFRRGELDLEAAFAGLPPADPEKWKRFREAGARVIELLEAQGRTKSD